MGQNQVRLTLLGIFVLYSLGWTQAALGQIQNPLNPIQNSTSTPLTADQQQNSSATNPNGSSTLPNCSMAQPGQACIKDSGAGNGSSSSTSTGPVISSGSDESDGEINPSGESVRTSAGQTSTGQPGQTSTSQNGTGDLGQPNNNLGTNTQQNFELKPLPPLPQNQFQRFVTTAIGNNLPMFGSRLFDKVPSTFAPSDQTPASANYVIGPGDQIVIRAWGQIDVNYKATVDRNGSIYIPRVGSIEVAGIKYSELTDYLRSQIGHVFRNFDLNVTLGKLRSIPIFVVGYARRPGGYTVSSLSTLVNAIFASGGPSVSGSMRHIELKRNDQVVTDFDLYDLLLRGDKSKDVQLLPGDVLYIPAIGPLVAISGSVNSPAIYELRGETSLAQVLNLAGGLSTTADGERVILERIDNHTVRHMEQFNLDTAGLAHPLRDGDIVTVFPLNPRFDNAVILRGNVSIPGRFPWHEGMRVTDLIPNRNSLITPDYWHKLNSSASTATPTTTATPVEHPTLASSGKTPALTSGEEQLRTQIQRTAPEINWEYAVIQRLNPDSLTSTLIPFNLGKALDGDPDANLVLHPGDVITIFSQADMRVPILQQSKYVHLEGEINPSGVYKALPGESLPHMVARIGGLTQDAYLYGARLTRESTRIEQQSRLDQISEQFSQDLERSAAEKSQNLANPAEAATLPVVIEAQRRLAERLKQVKATGRIVLNLKPTDDSISSLPNITLEDGDRLVIPYRPSTVSVLGAVYNQADFVYSPGREVGGYLKQAGGPTRTADKKRIYVIRANGSVTAMEGSSLFSGGIARERLYPGDTVVVPEQLNKTTFKKFLIDYSQILSQFGLGAAAIRVLTP